MRHLLSTVVVLTTVMTMPAVAQTGAKAIASKLVTDIQRADYEGNRAELQRLREALQSVKAPAGDRRFAAQIHYWQAFARWRRAINAFNEANAPDLADVERDARQCVADFEASLKADPTFSEASIGMIGCLQTLAFLHRNDVTKVMEFVDRFRILFKENGQAAPDNPRFLWLLGGGQWYAVPGTSNEELAKKQEQAFDTYHRGVALARKQPRPSSVLEPTWGEPELLMSLAWSSLNQLKPDVSAAEKYAQAALVLVPNWHYVKNVLMPQIRAARSRE
jgi:hypothetical protein